MSKQISFSNEPLTLLSLSEVCQSEPLRAFANDLFLPQLFSYLQLLIKWNKVMNLVGPSHWYDILSTLLVDSAYLATFMQSLDGYTKKENKTEIWDLGAGAGLPGIPLRILWKKGTYTLVEAREKRSLFLRTVLAAAPLERTFVFTGRAEAFMPSRPHADIVVSRAFMPVEKVIGLVKNFLASQSVCVFLTLTEPEGLLPLSLLPKVCGKKEYTVQGTSRWIWAVQCDK